MQCDHLFSLYSVCTVSLPSCDLVYENVTVHIPTGLAMEKEVTLERRDTFGLTVMGGAGTQLQPVVCEVTPGGPADLCRKVGVIMALNSHMV